MAHDHPEIIIIKRRVSHEEGHHGGAWKIAFADFMTAMTAFFLVLWIINATDKNTKTIIARYFNPVKLEDPSRAKKGIRAETAQKESGAAPSASEATPAAGPSPQPSPGAKESPAAQAGAPADAKAAPDSRANGASAETRLFADPYGSLDSILAADAAATPAPQDAAARDQVDPFRDPFLAGGAKTISAQENAPGAPPPSAAATPIAAPSPTVLPSPSPSTPQPQATVPGAADKPVDEREKNASRILAELKRKLPGIAGASSGPRLEVAATKEGILISLADQLDFSMFARGSAEPNARLIREMGAIAAILKSRPEQVVVRGHTDSLAYKSGPSDNWRLSFSRAQMAYYMLRRGGMPDARFDRIEGLSDHLPIDPGHKDAAENRRVEILLRADP